MKPHTQNCQDDFNTWQYFFVSQDCLTPPPPLPPYTFFQYSDKGEAYEYNASALERHMNTLATGNRARTDTTNSSDASLAAMRTRVFGPNASAVLRSAYAPSLSTAFGESRRTTGVEAAVAEA